MWWLGIGSASETRRLSGNTVTASDGVSLHVEIIDRHRTASPITVILSHGYLLDSESWQLQQSALFRRARLVLWDHRGHGRSGWGKPPNATVDQLGQDLYAVLEHTAPEGPVMLVGHSMGGMAILGLAEEHPELFQDRVRAVALIATSAGGLSGVTLGLPQRAAQLLHHTIRTSLQVLRYEPAVVDRVRQATSALAIRLTRRYLFGTATPVPAQTTRAMASTPIAVVAEFFAELDSFDKRAALSTLGSSRTLVLVGERDPITPVSHSETLVNAIPGARLVVVPDAAHLVMLEQSDEVNKQLRRLLTEVTHEAT